MLYTTEHDCIKPFIRLILIGIVICTSILTVVLFHNMLQSRQANRPLAIDESLMLTINNTPQWIRIRGNSPQTLFSRTSGPDYQIVPGPPHRHRTCPHSTVVHWDQRGTGNPDSGNTPEASVLNTYISDAKSLIRQLQESMAVEKIFLMGYSWGSIIGLEIAKTHPEWLHAYIGVSQIVNLSKSESDSYTTALALAKARQHDAAITALTAIGPPPYKDVHTFLEQRKWVQELGGFIRGHTQKEVLKTLGMATLSSPTMPCEILSIGIEPVAVFKATVPHLVFNQSRNHFNNHTPVTIISGMHDFTISHASTEQFYHQLNAPKGKPSSGFKRVHTCLS